MMKGLFRQKGAQLDINILASDEAQDFINTHAGVLDSSFEKVEMTPKMRERLTRSNYIFSGIKAFHELNEAFPSMVDENGNKKPFEKFLNDVRKIDEKYNANYLHSEYNFVAASATMAAKWEQFAEDGDRYYLQYRTAHDDKVRPEHAALDGVTLPMSDPFWETYYPPNGWNCRCSVVQVRKQKYTATDHSEAMSRGEEALSGDKLGMFRFNPGKQGKAMPDYNPYTIKRCNDCDVAKGGGLKLGFVPENQVCASCVLMYKCANARSKDGKTDLTQEEQNKIFAKPFAEQFEEKYKGKTGRVMQHKMACSNAKDYSRVMDVAKAFADMFGDCLINPEIDFNAKEGRKVIYKDLPEDCKANPDLWNKFGFVDVRSPEKPMNCCRNANHASDVQKACVCLTDHCFKKGITEKQIEDRNKAIWSSKLYHHDYIFWYVNGTLRKYKRPKA